MSSDSERYEAYLICKKRGHQSDGFTTASIPPRGRCKHCGTYFWTEHIERESQAPNPPNEDES